MAAITLHKTALGIQKSLNAQANGLKIRLSRYKLSSSRFVSSPNDSRESIPNIVHEGNIAVGQLSAELLTVRISLSILTTNAVNVGSMGLYLDDGTLFAVASVNSGWLFSTYPNITFISTFGFVVNEIQASVLQITTDNSGTAAQQLLVAHETAGNPHSQYTKKTDFDAFKNRINALFAELLHVGRWIGTDSRTWNPATAFQPFFGYQTVWRLRPYVPYGVSAASEAVNTITNVAGTNNAAMSNSTRIWKRMPDNYADPSYSLTANKSTANEGESVTFTLTTNNLDEGTRIGWAITGVSVADIMPSVLSGEFVIGANGNASYTVNIVNDQAVEGTETLTFRLTDPGLTGHSRSVVINDTSAKHDVVLNITTDWADRTIEGRKVVYAVDVWEKIQELYGLSVNQINSIAVHVRGGVTIVGENNGAGITFGNNLASIPKTLTVHANAEVFGGGGSRTTTQQQNPSMHGGAGIVAPATGVGLNVTNNGWISGGGGSGEGAEDTGYEDAGGGAPLGKGWDNGRDASLYLGGAPRTHRGNYGGNIGEDGDGQQSGNAGADTVGLVNRFGGSGDYGMR